jgi:hypothetical protein
VTVTPATVGDIVKDPVGCVVRDAVGNGEIDRAGVVETVTSEVRVTVRVPVLEPKR